MEMRRSKTLDLLRSGKSVSCTKINIADSRVVEIVAMSGIDCVWLDMEHTPNDYGMIEKQILAAKAYGADVMVRVPRGGYSDYVKPLELDASGIMVPHIMSLDDAKNVVKMTRFHPIGLRALDGGNADGGYCQVNLADYLKQANDRRFVCVQIEDTEPMAELDEIAALDGIDMLFFGPGDFSQGLGTPGDFNNPALLDARKKVADAAVRYGKFAGTVGSLANRAELAAMGYRFISIGADVVGLGNYFNEIAAGTQDEVGYYGVNSK